MASHSLSSMAAGIHLLVHIGTKPLVVVGAQAAEGGQIAGTRAEGHAIERHDLQWRRGTAAAASMDAESTDVDANGLRIAG